MWKQITTRRDGSVTEILRTDEKMLGLMAQMHFLRQAGEDITVSEECDDDWNVVAYTAIRKYKEGTFCTYRWEKVNG